jgi:CheY-like chemotaxis protein/anti-sigma regulatory factor (Ser/Thr protein kinase)
LELRTTRIELGSVVHQAVETCRSLAEDSGHELRVSVPESPIWVHGDPVRLAQVFSNLLNNACKFTEHAGKVSLVVERQSDEVAVSVTDTGIGIAPDKLESIFEMFQQVDQSLERTRGGLGIGLTLVKRLVELHGGRISVRSGGQGRGSEFIVRLRVLAEGDSPAAAPRESKAVVTQSQRILVIDDNRDAARSLAMLLQLSGHEVEMAHDGRQAIEQAEAWKPSVMLLDLGMPEMNGYDVCRTVRQTAWGKSIRIVALTGWGQDQDRRKTREAGFDDHLVKPVDPSVLNKILATNSSGE